MARSLTLALLALVALFGGAAPVAAKPAATSQNARKRLLAAVPERAQVVVDDFGNMEVRDAAGNVLAQSGVGLDYGFQGRRHDPETGLIYFRARTYDPATGRFIQRDPVWDPVNVGNPYTFVGNNPVTGRDPTGTVAFLAPLLAWGATEIGAGAFFAWAAGAGTAIYAGREAYVQSQTATEYDYGAIGRAGAGGSIIGLATAVPGGSYLGVAASGVVSQAGDDLARGQMSSLGQYAFAAATGPALKGAFGAASRALLASRGAYPGALQAPFQGSFDDLTKAIQGIDPAFKGFEFGQTIIGGTARYAPESKSILIAAARNAPHARGMVAEEVRHALDHLVHGIDAPAVANAFRMDKRFFSANLPFERTYNWLHRRVFTRLMQDVDRGDAIIGSILGKSDMPFLHEAYRTQYYGTKGLDWLLRQNFPGPF